MRGVTVRGNPTFTWSGQQRPIRLRRLVQKERENVVSQKLGQRRVEPEGAGCEAEVGCSPGGALAASADELGLREWGDEGRCCRAGWVLGGR